MISSVATSPGAEALRQAFSTLYKKQADLAAARQLYTDEYQVVRDLITAVNDLQTQDHPKPREAAADTAQAARRGIRRPYRRVIERDAGDSDADDRGNASSPRSSIADNLYTTLKSNSAAANLAAAGHIRTSMSSTPPSRRFRPRETRR